MPNKSVLILGGTRQALDLATALTNLGAYRVITSLAGRTKAPTQPAGELRIGGFGGIQAMAGYLAAENIDALIDATHPFAAVISKNAAAASEIVYVPRLNLQRPPWQSGHEKNWQELPSLKAAADALETGARCFLTIGRQELDAFHHRTDVFFLIRMIDKPEFSLPLATYEIITGLPQASCEDEKNLMQAYGIDTLVTKNSGGELGQAKLEAARILGIKILMIDRPPLPKGDVAETVEDAVAWLITTINR